MTKRIQRDVQHNMQQLGQMFENMKEHHLDPANKPKRSNLSLLLGLIPHIVIFVFTAAVVWVAKPSSSLFSWHPTLMSLAYGVLMTEAILLFSPWSSPFLGFGERPKKVRWHWVLQACAVGCSFTGVIIITANKMLHGSKHYSTYHGVMGIMLCSIIFLQTTGGILVMFPDLLPFKLRLVVLKRLHAANGLLTYGGGLVTLTLGVFSSWFVANAHPSLWKVCVTCPAILGFAVVLQLLNNYLWRF